jgi:steroid Delta-isomerase
MVRSPAPDNDRILTTIQRYQSTFSASDREGWLRLFADDAVVEDPVGAPPRVGRDEIAAFWDEIHSRLDEATVRMTQGPAICGLEAAWAFQLQVQAGEHTVRIDIIDHGTFDDEGRIRSIRAFWNELPRS